MKFGLKLAVKVMKGLVLASQVFIDRSYLRLKLIGYLPYLSLFFGPQLNHLTLTVAVGSCQAGHLAEEHQARVPVDQGLEFGLGWIILWRGHQLAPLYFRHYC
jgi:hypothetical protein